MIVSKKSGNFTPHPEYTGQAVCVDVTPTKKVQSKFGEKDEFRIVFETTEMMEAKDKFPERPFTIGKNFTPSLSEKANLRKFLKSWFGRDLTTDEENGLDTESLIGKTAQLTVVQEEGADGKTYANIALIRPDKSGTPLAASGHYTRVKDREDKGRGDATYQRTASASTHDDGSAEPTDWRMTKVHVGRHAGVNLCELDADAVKNLIEHWIPQARAKGKLLADDKRLIAALEFAKKELVAAGPKDDDDEIPY